jgi:hypothetical protein
MKIHRKQLQHFLLAYRKYLKQPYMPDSHDICSKKKSLDERQSKDSSSAVILRW